MATVNSLFYRSVSVRSAVCSGGCFCATPPHSFISFVSSGGLTLARVIACMCPALFTYIYSDETVHVLAGNDIHIIITISVAYIPPYVRPPAGCVSGVWRIIYIATIYYNVNWRRTGCVCETRVHTSRVSDSSRKCTVSLFVRYMRIIYFTLWYTLGVFFLYASV